MHFARLAIALFLPLLFTAPALAQGLELSLHGHLNPRYGEELRVAGTAYEVDGLAELKPARGSQVVLRLRDYQRQRWVVVQESTVPTDDRGRFSGAVAIPESRFASAQLQVEVRSGQQTRTFEYGLGIQQPIAIDLRTDRNRYEPDETVHVWARVHRLSNGAPVARRSVKVTVRDPQGRPLVERTMPTSDAGVASLELPLPASAVDGHYAVQVQLEDSIAEAGAASSFQVARRTVERLQVDATLDQRVVAPSARLTGRVRVRTPSGVPIANAAVQLTIEGRNSEVLTDAEGVAPIRLQAPAYLAGDVQAQQVVVRVAHPAHGVLHVVAPFLLSRVEWRVEATAENGGLVPEVDAEAMLLVTDPRGEPAPAGSEITVRGASVARGSVTLRTDRHGLAVLPMRVPDGAAGPLRNECGGRFATRVDVEVRPAIDGARPTFARVCVPVSPDARVRGRVRERVVEPGGTVAIALDRHPEVRGREVLVEAIAEGRVVAATHARGDEGRLTLPPGVSGVLQIRVRPELAHDARHPLDEPGGSQLGVGSVDAVLVRPRDAFALSIETGRDVFRVRETASLALRTTSASPRAWAAVVARDLMMHGGEEPFSMAWMRGALTDAAARPDTEEATLLLRSALTAGLSPDTKPHRAPPLVQPYWRDRNDGGHQDGTLRDPVAMRDDMLRRHVGQIAAQLERLVQQRVHDPDRRRGFLVERGGRFDFDPEAFATLRRERAYAPDNLGGQPVTLAMVRAADPSFSFDAVARRLARQHLVRLLVALSRLTDGDDAQAARASAGQPPERWLSRLVQLGVLGPNDLLDPWGRPFELRPSATPRVLFSERAPNWELSSSGPDGRFGTADDVRDPFVRVVPEGTPYAVASGEDRLMKSLSTLAPGPQTLQAMARAYASVSLAARDEQRARTVTATVSEGGEMLAGDDMEDASGYGGLALGGSGRGGGGAAFGTAMAAEPAPAPPGARRQARSRASADEAEMPMEEAAMERSEMDDDTRNAQQIVLNAPSSPMAQLSAIVREDFPATLRFWAEVPLDGTSTTIELPLADALTTYRVEAIAWTDTGWVTTASTDVRVDQEATVDAPVPGFATVGDGLRVPVRVQNRTTQPLEVRVVIESEGLGVTLPQEQRITVPPRDAIERIVPIATPNAGSGHLVVRVLRASDGAPYDAVRRPVTVFQDGWLVRDRREVLTEPGQAVAELSFATPAGASERGPGELRVVPATALFGDLATYADGTSVAGWGLALRGDAIPESVLLRARAVLRAADPVEEHDLYGDPVELGRAIAAVWNDATVGDAIVRRGLRAMSTQLGESPSAPDAGRAYVAARTVLALAPTLSRLGQRRQVAPTLRTLVDRLSRDAGSGAVEVSDQPVLHATVAAALALAGENDRAKELLRRVERFVVRLEPLPSGAAEEAFLEDPSNAGEIHARIAPTSLVVLAHAGLGQPAEGLPFLRNLVALAGASEAWDVETRALATAAASTLAGGSAGAQMTATLDGRPLELRASDEDAGVRLAVVEGMARPGRHVIRVQHAGAFALAFVDVRYGRAWDAPPQRTLRADLQLDGPLGPRDARAGLLLTIRNREARVLERPVVEIDLPAGTELDEPTREALLGAARGAPTQEGRTLRLPLRPLAPGGYVRIPLPLRWSVGGSLRGLGVVLVDEAQPPSGEGGRAGALLPSRTITIDDRGAEPETPEGNASPVPTPPPPPPPLLPVEPFGPVASAAPSVGSSNAGSSRVGSEVRS
ncbi:MAG: MG2 domain-containing protein [Polyangiales bacterium]